MLMFGRIVKHWFFGKHRSCRPIGTSGLGLSCGSLRFADPPSFAKATAGSLRLASAPAGLPAEAASAAKAGGAEGDRTPDLCSAIAALSQLSYGPVPSGGRLR